MDNIFVLSIYSVSALTTTEGATLTLDTTWAAAMATDTSTAYSAVVTPTQSAVSIVYMIKKTAKVYIEKYVVW